LRAYYASSAFRRRQRRIASGEILPRILVNTCRWTTFLKYCAADFEKAFTTLGCPTRFVIEENDVQTLLPAFYWRELAAFRPDAIFMVSHARPSMPQLPRELPFLSYVQDKCGPLLTHAKLAEHTSGEDLFICLSADHQLFLTAKGVPAAQTFVMPVPVDELMFHPLPADHLRGPEYTVDTSFVKHGTPHAADALAGFLSRATGGIPSGSSRQELTRLFEELYRASCLNVETCWYEADLKRFVADRLSPSVNDQLRHFLDQLVAAFYTTVYSPAWRYQFLEALDEAGIELALYGRNWAQNKRLLHLDRGPVDRERQLNYVYNFTRVNLSINHALSMTPRLVECALAGGFCMVAAHPADRDSLPADAYFEPEKELVRFTTPRDLVDRCRHYLAHPEERRDIACAIRERALAERTCSAGARTVLARWRTLLRGRQATP
jgi:spore maturation protein CgeB